jgi:uncharacterized alkaline shock family protein YloU
MNLIFRIMLAVYASCLTIITMIAMTVTLRPKMLLSISSQLYENILKHRNPSIILFIIELIFLGLSMMFLLSGVKSDREKKAITRVNNAGVIRISLSSIESIVLNVTKKIGGIKETKAIINKHGENVSISVKVVLFSDINIPTLLEDVQFKVKKTVEELTNVKVLEVSTSVENVYTGYKNRVE